MSIPLLYSIGDFVGLLGFGILQAFGGSFLLLGMASLFAIAFFSWKFNVHITVAFFFSFIALTFMRIYFNDAMGTDIGLFGTLYNLMLLGMAIVFVLFISDLRK